MCPHDWRQINDVTVCVRCGMTRTKDGKVFFDRKLPNYKAKRGKKKK